MKASKRPTLGGFRQGSGPKSQFRNKGKSHSVLMTPEGLARLLVQSRNAGVSRADYIEGQLRSHGDTLDLGERIGRTFFPGKDPRPRSFRLTRDASLILTRLVRRLKASEGEVVEGLIRQGKAVTFTEAA